MTMPIFQENYPLRAYNTFGFVAKARFWAEFNTDDQLRNILLECRKNEIGWRILGGGSNIVLSRDIDECVIHPVCDRIEKTGTLFVVDAGVDWDRFVGIAVESGFAGVENLSFIPGMVGASPVQNIGAYGSEVKKTIEWVEYLDAETLGVVRIAGSNCEFGYRDSIFKRKLRGKAIVLRVAFRLSENPELNVDYGDVRTEIERLGGVSLKNIRQAITNIRRSKLPDPQEIGSAGSFFKNPVVSVELTENLLGKYSDMPNYVVDNGRKIPAGWLIDKAGWKGFRDSDAGVHPKQALVLVNYGSASAHDILNLAERIVADVYLKFGVTLEKEVNVW